MRHNGGQVFRITEARTGLSEDVRGRQRRYVISMAVRTLCFLSAVFLWDVSRPLAWLALVGGAVLPYIAVVIANAGRENPPGLPHGMTYSQSAPQLEKHPHDHTPPTPSSTPENDPR